MANEKRTFVSEQAVRDSIPLVIGITGFSGAGKTFSAHRLAAGIHRVYGGNAVYAIDADNGRMKQYAPEPGKAAGPGEFNFVRVPLTPPHGPLDWMAAIDHCVNEGAKVIVCDPMSYEHDGEGGVLEQFEAWMQAKCGNDWDKRARMNQAGWGAVKKPRALLNRRIKSLVGVAFVLTYQAKEKMQMDKGKAPESKGWQPVTTSDLIADMTLRFLLHPGADGVPDLKGETPAEKMLIKSSGSFRGWFKGGEPLTEDLGEKIARWTKGGGVGAIGASLAPSQETPKQPVKSRSQAPASTQAPSNKLAFSGGYSVVELRNTPVESATLEQIATYTAYLQAVIEDASKAGAHAQVRTHLEAVQELQMQLAAEARMKAGEAA